MTAPAGGRAVSGPLRRALRVGNAVWLPVALGVWWWFGDGGSQYFPPLSTIVRRIPGLWITGDAKYDLLSSLENLAIGFVAAGLLGVGLGAALWKLPGLRLAVSPIMYFVYVLPSVATLPVIITLFGLTRTTSIVMIATAATWPTLLNTVDGMRSVDMTQLDTARALRLTAARTLRSVVLPAAAPQIIAGLRNSLQVAIIMMVVSEMVGSAEGLGFFILQAQQNYSVLDMWTGIIVLIVLGVVLNGAFVLVERRALRWYYGARRSEGSRLMPEISAPAGRAGAPARTADVPILRIAGLRKVYNPGTPAERVAIDEVSFDVHAGEFVCIVGPSGAGKTSLLRCLCGLASPTGGTTMFEGQVLDRVPDKLGVVLQDYSRSLFPWMSVAGNIDLPMRVRHLPAPERGRRIGEVLAAVGLSGVEKQYPWQLSGGMQQRVAIARALACRPDLLLMDEPFASVDAQTRFDLEDLLRRVHAEQNVTVVFVTHDIDEAVYLADRVVVMSKAPSRVRDIMDVALGDDRSQDATRARPEFIRMRQRLLTLIRGGE